MTFEQIFRHWPSTAEFARDIGVTIDLASKYRRVRGIPSERWRDVLAAAAERGYPVTAENLMDAEIRSRALNRRKAKRRKNGCAA